ncbi:MAG: Ppx/GppA family phosphatase [Balneolaceae bacterium]|nr:Ppx/GppA family phosphatase [Balneolaceae bacterium]MBO6545257.1 Ppx/GppA family phosphatase [Balneolaceae bacterium]MBO6646653.1 Ppx/GppA family phosphatase [Balneolaceae bacterium]
MTQLPSHINSTTSIKRLAAIDLGTNSFHAVIVDIFPDGSFRKVDDLKEMVQLAKGGLGKRLADAAFKRGIEALKKIKVLCDSQGVERILAYATSAIREAENGGEFIQKSIDDIGIKINAIPGSMEAELIGYAVQHGVKLNEDPVLMVDIGGGSVEFILGNHEEFFFLTSKKIGVSRMTDIFKPGDPITQEDINKMEAHYAEELNNVEAAVKKNPTKTIVGSSGTMQNIALMIANQKGLPTDVTLNEFEFSAKDFSKFYADFIKLDSKKRLKVSGLDTKRVDFINTGVVLVNLLINKFGIESFKISTQALREGIIIRYLKKDMIGIPWSGEFPDPRRRSVFELLRKCNWHEEHSRHVAKLALILFDELKGYLGLADEDRELLEYAAYLHDIGYYISHSKHHKHALYIIRHSDLMGFRENEIEIIANVSRYHRRSTPKKRHGEYWKLKPTVRSIIKKLSAILRVADGLDRSHFQNVYKLEVKILEDKLLLEIQTVDEPHLEIWGAMRKSHLMREVMGKKVVIERV